MGSSATGEGGGRKPPRRSESSGDDGDSCGLSGGCGGPLLLPLPLAAGGQKMTMPAVPAVRILASWGSTTASDPHHSTEGGGRVLLGEAGEEEESG